MLLELNKISFSYGDTKVLKEISFTGDRGQVIALIGENGAGKSTTIKNIVRYLTPDSGNILFDGKDIFKINIENYPLSYVPDTPIFYEELSLLEHLHFMKAIYPHNNVIVDDILDRMELREHLNKIPSALSKGTRQKLMIAMALLREYEIIVLDEPFSGLDPKQIAMLKDTILQEAEQGKLVLLSSHLLDLVENLCDRYVIIKNGTIIADGTKEELLSKANMDFGSTMESVYLNLVGLYDE
ncbi:MAG: ABC transporter ATP-binding protein [Candidatus Scatomorpha sp.]|jgi:ABC-2 type transport system ATP-binding protein